MKQITLLFFILYGQFIFACQCPVTELSEKELMKYDLIFKGKIQSIKLNKERSEAMFLVEELYKGNTAPSFRIIFNDLDNCKLELRAGDEWIIYTNYHQVDNAKLDFCSRSRKFFKVAKEDFFAVTTGISYEEEMRFLQTKLGLHKLLKDNPNKVENRNIIPSNNQFIIIIICSIAGVLMIYVIVNKLFKKYS
jgi:hypothetical protein